MTSRARVVYVLVTLAEPPALMIAGSGQNEHRARLPLYFCIAPYP